MLLCLLFCFLPVKAKTERQHFKIHYVVDIPEIDTTFLDNKERIAELRDFLRTIRNDSLVVVDSVKFTGTASPDGYIEFNKWLSENRLENFKKLAREEIDLPDSIIYLNDSHITWQMFYDAVKKSNIPQRDTVLAVLEWEPKAVPWYKNMHTDHRVLHLRTMDKGRVWETLKPILFYERYADAEFVLHHRMPQLYLPLEIYTAAPSPDKGIYVPVYDYSRMVRRLYIKNNLVKDALLLPNLSFEIDIAKHFSFDLTGFYSKWDYFTPKIKFRFAGFMAELRYWFNPEENDGWFIGGHYGYSYYNLAFNGAHRYQDKYGSTPTQGGGLSFGWRMKFGHNDRWRLELAAGAGIYPLKYSVFHNTPDYRDGQFIEWRKKTFIGPDVLSVSIGYAIDYIKREKRTLKGFVK